MNDIIIGIDLGTTNSEVAIVENGNIHVIDSNGVKILPSFVGIGDNGELLVGAPARNQYPVYPERTVKSIKRLMGQNTQVELAGQHYTPPEISAIILKKLKNMAEDYLKTPVKQAVITVPAYFSDAQRQATREAGEIAGLEVMRMINEPTAAALVYGAGQCDAKTLLVYDLGGGTFDVSVVKVENGVVEVVSSHGDNHLGGDDFDQQIVNFLIEHLQTQNQVDVRAHTQAMARILRAAEQAKLLLSDQPYALIEEEYLLTQDNAPVHLSVELARADYEDMIEDYINATMDAVHIALKDAKMTSRAIDEVILVGGSTRTPYIRERIVDEFGFEPHGEIDADLCVAMGAAVQAAMIAGQQVDTVLVDVTPYTYGTSALGYLHGEPYPFMYVPVIHKNSVLPSRKTEAFMTTRDGQEGVEVSLYQGEDPDALNNIKIGEFYIEGLRDVAAGNIITLTLDLDLNGLLHVSAQEKATGLEKSITIKNVLSPFDSSALQTARQRITSLFGQMEPKSQPEPEAVSSPEVLAAQAVVKKARNLLAQATSEDQEDMINLIETITDRIDQGDIAGLANSVEQLNDIIYYLES
jgi:molecular chaperone DnaK